MTTPIGIICSRAIPDGMVIFMSGHRIVRVHMPGSGPIVAPGSYSTIHVSPAMERQWIGESVKANPPKAKQPNRARDKRRGRVQRAGASK